MDYISYLEKRKHGIAAFPIQYYFVDDTHPRYVMNAHWHREFEIIRILSGSFTAYLNNTEIYLEQGDVLFVECNCLHRGQPHNCVYECIVVDLKMLSTQKSGIIDQYISEILNSKINIKNIVSKSDCELYQTVNELFVALNNEKPYYELTVCGLLFNLISQMYSYGYISNPSYTYSNKQVEQIGMIIDWINQNLKEPVNSKKLSEISNLNFNYLCKIFKNFTGKTIVQYVNEQRIEHACYDIAKKNKSITEAAFSNGFNDLSYFTKTFKRYKGITPREFKTFAKKA
jgi:AraC-like DNA-binding protein